MKKCSVFTKGYVCHFYSLERKITFTPQGVKVTFLSDYLSNLKDKIREGHRKKQYSSGIFFTEFVVHIFSSKQSLMQFCEKN